MKILRFISPSKFYYWEKCPLKALFSKEYKGSQFFPKHPDADLGILIHSFYENIDKWDISDYENFENRWNEEIFKINNSYKSHKLQNIYYPISWHSRYYAIKKELLRNNLLGQLISQPLPIKQTKIEYEKWIDDGSDIGGKVDCVIYNKDAKIITIIDFKSGKIHSLKNKGKKVKEEYIYQLILYSHIISKKQNFYPSCLLQNIKGEFIKIEFDTSRAEEIYRRAVNLKLMINQSVENNTTDTIANPQYENCFSCDFRPICLPYKNKLINNFNNIHVDVFGKVKEIIGLKDICIKLQIDDRVILLKNIKSSDTIKVGDDIFIYNLFCPDNKSPILYAVRGTMIYHDNK